MSGAREPADPIRPDADRSDPIRADASGPDAVARPTGEALLDALEAGHLRVAEPRADGTWVVHGWIREEILKLFRSSPVVPLGGGAAPSASARGAAGDDPGRHPFLDKAAFPPRRFALADDVRLVPGGSAVRRGAYLGRGVVCMPPMYVNVGAWVGDGTLVDSHALIGSCAQVGSGVHVSAGAQVGGVLEPPAARPVIVEDGAFVGGNCGLYEGVRVGAGAVLAAGVVLAATTPLYDLVHECERTGTSAEPLVVPPGAVVVPGTRPAGGEWARARGLQAACALVVKYRDAGTDARTALEGALRPPAGTAGGA
jgi:2,3,4,5-tetrahydropyridine-2-carboxylate N-succinyltransferase